jgi:hypothetical protein
MKRFSLPALVVAVLISTAGRALAWNSVGHMAVSKLAYEQLDDKSRLALFEILKSHPHYKEFLAVGRPADTSEVEWAVLRCSFWPDWVRPRRKDAREVSKYHRGEEHYVNIPLIDPKDEKAFAGKTLIDPDLPNIVTALKQRANDIKTKTVSPEDRAVALCWLFHLVGDIHQPMHNVAYFSSDPAFARGDLGGNKFGIMADGKRWRLHAFWDDLLGLDADYADDSSGHQANLVNQAVKIALKLKAMPMSDAECDKLKNNTTFESWSREGFELARTVAYQKGDGSGLLKPVEIKGDRIPDEVEEVGKQYIERARATAQRQAILAGRRLANRINMVIKS